MKTKRIKWIGIGLAVVIVLSALTAGLVILTGKAASESEYVYAAAAENLPEYDTDLFNIDGKLDEEIYSRLRWWDESYSEGDVQEPVRVRATSYLGKNGVYFIFDVTDDKVYVDMMRSSYNNSAMTVYVAAEGTHALKDNVWEIDILPNNYISARRYTGGYYYASVRAKGWENQPFVCTTTKGGDINTADCKGYIMESYFPYNYLFDGVDVPENINVNFALERSYSLESDSRDVYYNFGQNIMSNWSWNDPGTWWVFNKSGLDSVDLIFDADQGGKLEHRNDYIARYQTEKIKITPDEGYRIKAIDMETGGVTKDVTDQITWEDGENYIKIRNATENVRLAASFEKIPDTKATLTGNVTLSGSALSAEVREDIGVRFISGGVAYAGTLNGKGAYSLEVPTGSGVLELFSEKNKYVAKRIPITVTKNVKTDIALTADDYGKNRVTGLTNEQVMGNREKLFDGSAMTESISTTFAYDFTLKYNGKMLEEDGIPVADPTFGEFDHQYTAINHRFIFTDAEGKAINNSDMRLQIMSWDGNGMWMAKLWLDGKSVTARIGIDELKAFCSEDGVHFRIIFADSKMALYMVRDGMTFKLKELGATSAAERYLKTVEFAADHCVRHSIWYVKEQKLSFGRTQSSYPVTAVLANGDGKVDFNTREENQNIRTSTSWDISDFNGAFGWSGELRVPGIIKNGKIKYREMVTGYWVDTSKDKKSWYQYNVFIIGDGGEYYITKTGKTTKLKLSEEQIKLLGTTGLRVGAFANGKTASFFVDNGSGEMAVFADLHDYNENSLWFPWPNQYNGAFIVHEGASGLGKVISNGAEFFTGLSKDMDARTFVENILEKKYQSVQQLNPVSQKMGAGNKTYFVMNHSDISQNVFYGYNIKSDVADSDGNIKKIASVYFNTKAWSESKYYSNYLKLRITSDSAYFVWQQGTAPYASSQAVYFLNQKQLALLAKGGLNIYIEYKDNSPEMNLYVDNGNGDVVLASTYREELFKQSTGVTYVKNTNGYSVQVVGDDAEFTIDATGCVTSTGGDFASTVEALYDKSVVNAEKQPDIQKIDSAAITKTGDKIDNDYLSFNIGGNWFDRFNVKVAGAADAKGEIAETATVKLNARIDGDKYYGQTLDLHLTNGKIGYVEYVNYGGNWEKYRYSLTSAQLAKLSSAEGLNLFVSHKANENVITLYVEDGTELVPLKTMEYGSKELWAKGYFSSYEAENNAAVEVTIDCYKYSDNYTLEKALKQAYGKLYNVTTEEPLRYMECVNAVKEFSGSEKETLMVDKHNAAVDHSVWQLILKSDAVDKDGNVVKDATVQSVVFGNKYNYQFDATLKLTQTESKLTLQEGRSGNWAMHTYYMNEAQLAQLASDNGLVLYISYEQDEITLYVKESENTLLKALSFKQADISFNDTRLYFEQSEAYLNAEMNCYTYTNGSFSDIIKAAYNGEYTVREKTKLENARVTMHKINEPSEKVSLDYGNSVVGGKWVQHFSLKCNPERDSNGKIAENTTLSSLTRLYSDKYYQQIVNLRLTEGGAYLDMPEYGGDWGTYTYPLSNELLEKLYGADGLDIYVTCEEENKISVYLAAGSELIRIKDFTYGTGALKAKGYSMSYAGNGGDTVAMVSECAAVGGELSDIWSDLFEKEYNRSDSSGLYSYVNSVVAKSFGKTFTSNDKSNLEKYMKLWNNYFYRINIQNMGVNEEGVVTADSKISVYHQGESSKYVGQTVAILDLHKDGDSTLELQLGISPWTTKKVTLTDGQLKAIGSAKGLNIYIAHSAAAPDMFVTYVQDNNVLREMFTAKLPGATHGNLCRITCGELTADITVKGEAYNYSDTDLLTALRTIYGNDYSLAKKVDVTVKNEHTAVSGIKEIYNVGDEVLFTVKANSGYELTAVKFNDTVLQADKDGKYSFTLTEDYADGCTVKIETLREFKTLTAINGNTGDFSKENGKQSEIEKSMLGGTPYLFHTNFKTTDDAMNAYTGKDDTGKEISYMEVKFEGWGSKAEQYYIRLYRNESTWSLRLQASTLANPVSDYKLTDGQIAELTNGGLDIFFVKSGAYTYTAYAEKDGLIDTVGSFTSSVANKKVYRVTHTSRDAKANFTTTGYFYDSYTSAEDAIGYVLSKAK